MLLPVNFQFTQNNLQDYVDCGRRFYLRYLRRLEWPAVQTQPVIEQERRLELGKQFHRMVQQDILGIPKEHITRQAETDPELRSWWNNFTKVDPLVMLPSARFPEYMLWFPFAGYRLAAKYDLLAVHPGGEALIMDWKTSSRRPGRGYLENRLQTRVYPFVLASAGDILNDRAPIPPERIEIRYWFPISPENPIRFPYSTEKLAQDHSFLEALIREIASLDETGFTPVENEKICQFCAYRSYCDRGTQAGSWLGLEDDELEDPSDLGLDFDFEDIGEIAF